MDDEKAAKIQRQTQQRGLRFLLFVAAAVALIVTVAYPEFVKEQKREHQALLKDAELRYTNTELEVRAIKASGVKIMETDEKSLEATGRLKAVARELCHLKYGSLEPYHIEVDIEFQMDGLSEEERHAQLVIETAPLDLIPYSVYNFLEIARGYKKGGFHRKAPHVLQVSVNSDVTQKLAFQEYSKDYPHKLGTVGYCGRPSGPCWYVSTKDNSANHGPGSQQQANPYEADANFGRIIEGFDNVVPRIRDAMPKPGFLNNKKDWVLITGMHISVPDGSGGYEKWVDESATNLRVGGV